MLKKKLVFAALAAVLVHTPSVFGQAVNWSVVAGESSAIVTPDLPPNVGRDFTDVRLGDVGAGLVGFRITSPDASDGYWARNRQGALKRYMQPGVTGAFGPGRSGTESGHVFRDYNTGWGAAGADGQRYFVARAGAPAAPDAELSYGLWRWNTTSNIEHARTLTDGSLGPNLGAGWVFPNSSGFINGFLESNGGTALFRADLLSPTGATGIGYFKSAPGQSNQPCLMVGSTDARFSPGLGSGTFDSSPWSLATTPQGKFYGHFETSTSREGVWEICNGAPQALVVDEEPGARGPDIGIETAYFSTFYGAPVPGDANTFFFVAGFRENASGANFSGVFLHGASNRPLALKGDTADYSPHWLDSTFDSFYYDTLSAAGGYAAIEADLSTSDGGDPHGLWRIRADGSPELVALIGLIGAYGPEPNRTWRDFSDSAVLANGDIVLEATTDPGAERALWLLQSGRAPRRIFMTGQSVSVPIATGVGQTAVSSWSLPQEDGEGAQYGRGIDSWIGADGTILIEANLEDYSGTTLLMAQPSNPIDLIFGNGFDG